ncbi:MAG: malto-oligosyltrehalose synthase [Gammaproteobacteria bacterium]
MSNLEALAEVLGLIRSYTEIDGTRCEVPQGSLRALVEGLGYTGDEHGAQEALHALAQEGGSRLAQPAVASFESGPPRVELNARALAGDTLEWTLAGEGMETSGRIATADLDIGGGKPLLTLPPLSPGYYQLSLRSGANTAETLLVRAPEKAWLPDQPARGYGFSIQLYEQIGPTSIGLGDFTDLAGLGEAAGAMGAATLGINPLHALFLAAPERASPYSPSSRLALNPLYLDVRRLPGSDDALHARFEKSAFQARVRALNAGRLIDYATVAVEKLACARAAFEGFRYSGSDAIFDKFRSQASRGIADWVQFETLAAEFSADLSAWPSAMLDRQDAALEHFCAQHRDTYDFHLWLQWQADAQLEAAARRARAAGLGIGLYHDLALGADPAGAEVWAGRGDFATALAVGAPPDPLNPRGQNWGFPPLHPQRLVERQLAPFIELVRTNMRHAGALRIDHVLGLNRLFVIPPGATPADGAYLRYPLDLMLAVIVLESNRARCVVVGEDLGTVPEGLRARLAERSILSLRLLYFEHTETGLPLAPEHYPREALAAVGTHDIIPLPGWWRGEDLVRMDRLSLWPSEEARAAAHTARPTERDALREGFLRAGLPGVEEEPPAAAAYRWLARTPSRLLMIQPEDALEITDPVNVPGTTDEEPNWRRRRVPPWFEWLADPRFIEVVRAVQAERGAPAPRVQFALTATYRVQLNADFGFGEATALVPYLSRLGVSHLYLSPVMSAVPGSTHGYDMTDPARLDESRGGQTKFAELHTALKRAGMQLVVDFVPSHMGAHPANPWWMDLLEWGHASAHDASFDVDWSGEEARLLVPVLAARFGEVLTRGDIHLAFDPAGRFCARYFSHLLPLAPASTAALVRLAARRVRAPGYAQLATLARRLRGLAAVPASERRVAGLTLEAELATLAEDACILKTLDEAAVEFSCDAGRMARLLELQAWRLVHWRRAVEEINYRRFFDIADLAAIRMERPAVFGAVHTGIRRLLAEGSVQGLRLDHVDGLAAPGRYLERLRELVEVHGGGVPLWVEKILAADEALCPWPVAGTTGYEFLNDATRLFVPAAGAARLRALWREFVPDARPFDETLALAKYETVEDLFAPMLDRIVTALAGRAPVAPERIRTALVEILVALPVYRAYPDAPAAAHATQEAIVARAAAAVHNVETREWLGHLLALPLDEAARLPAPLRDGVARFWQLASVAMAKGLGDTAFYRDFSLLALNEVGGDPRVASLSSEDFHARLAQRARDWPATLNASATHDTKRGEDARMRLAMLAAHADEWQRLVPQLRSAAMPLRPHGLHPADEYLVWQTLLAVWPPPVIAVPGAATRESLTARLAEYLVKALREGKQRSSWLAPDTTYEKKLAAYATALVDPARAGDFQHDFLPFAAAVARSGALASLAALTLKCIAPGVPDLYQGTELWDLSLVDPDNRRAVDYENRISILKVLNQTAGHEPDENRVKRLLTDWPDGRIKYFVLARLLALRRLLPDTFADGGYRPLTVVGAHRDDVLAFARGTNNNRVIVAVARVNPALEVQGTCALASVAWGDTRIAFDDLRTWRDALTGRRYTGGELSIGELLAPLPAAVLVAEAGWGA